MSWWDTSHWSQFCDRDRFAHILIQVMVMNLVQVSSGDVEELFMDTVLELVMTLVPGHESGECWEYGVVVPAHPHPQHGQYHDQSHCQCHYHHHSTIISVIIPVISGLTCSCVEYFSYGSRSRWWTWNIFDNIVDWHQVTVTSPSIANQLQVIPPRHIGENYLCQIAVAHI